MFRQLHIETGSTIVCALAACGALLVTPLTAGEVDWDGIDATGLTLFQPGQVSWEWLLIPGDHGANPARRLREGRPCLECHQGEEVVIGREAISGGDLDARPLTGMPGSVEIELRAAASNGNLHLRVAWPAISGDGPAGDGKAHAMLTFLVGDDETLPAARFASCWASCHSDLPGMPADADKDLSKYLPNSRASMARTGGADNYKDAAELAAELEKGAYLEFWKVFIDPDGVAEVIDGYFLEARRSHADSRIDATLTREGNNWIVEITRPLAPGDAQRKSLQAGKEYPFSIALHENHTTGRYHYVSFPYRMKIADPTVTISEVTE